MVLVVASFGISIIPGLNLGIVFGVVGSVTGIPLVFLLPCIFYLKLCPDPVLKSPRKLFSIFIIVFGVVVGVLSLYAIISNPNSTSCQPPHDRG